MICVFHICRVNHIEIKHHIINYEHYEYYEHYEHYELYERYEHCLIHVQIYFQAIVCPTSALFILEGMEPQGREGTARIIWLITSEVSMGYRTLTRAVK